MMIEEWKPDKTNFEFWTFPLMMKKPVLPATRTKATRLNMNITKRTIVTSQPF